MRTNIYYIVLRDASTPVSFVAINFYMQLTNIKHNEMCRIVITDYLIGRAQTIAPLRIINCVALPERNKIL
jgi:hypothetical protein